ncbi:uncharacterized protein LOC144121019 [Amblyomma americanum]
MTGNGPAETEAPVSLAARRLPENEKTSSETTMVRSTAAAKRRHPKPAKKATKAKRTRTTPTTRKRKRKATRTITTAISFTSTATHTGVAHGNVGGKSAIEDIRISDEPPDELPRTKSHIPSKTTDSVRRMVPKNDDRASNDLGGRVSTGSGKSGQRQSSTDLPSASPLLPSRSSHHSDGMLGRSASDALNATELVFTSRTPSKTPSSTALPTIFSTPSETFQRTSWGENGSAYANFTSEDPFTLNDFLQ